MNLETNPQKVVAKSPKNKVISVPSINTILSIAPFQKVWRLSSGKDLIECQSEAEAEHLKIWLEAGLEEVKVPNDESYLSIILPELKALKERIDLIISDHISTITSQKLQGELF